MCIVFHRNGKHLFSAPRHDRAIELILYSERLLRSYSLNAISELPIKLWHERMGHLNWDALNKTQSTTSPPIVGMWFDESEPHHSKCEGCIAGKSKRRAYKSSVSGPTSKVTLMKAVDELVWANSQMLGCRGIFTVGLLQPLEFDIAVRGPKTG